MPFVTQGKTNLSYILIIIILAVIVGGGIYLFSKGELKLPEVQPPETPEVTAELLTSCITDTDCERYIVYNQCKVYCANKDEANLQIIKKLEETKLCDPTLWFAPPLNCGCVDNQCAVKQEEKTEDETANWKTFRGEIVGWPAGKGYKFEFQVPQEFVETIPYPWIDPEGYKYYYGVEGPGISLFVGLMEGPGLLTILHGRANQTPLCSNPLEINEKYYGSQAVFEACDVMQIGGRDALFLIRTVLLGIGGPCQPGAAVHVVHNLDDNGSVLFTVELEVLKEITELWPEIPPDYSFLDDEGKMWLCPPDINHSKVKESFVSQISNIRNAENLSQEDTERLKNIYQILSTFKFLD